MRDTSYTITLENFAGPLDLLLQLIERQKLNICDVSLAKVTQDYIRSIQDLVIDPHQANWFLDIASRLIMHKSRALLPHAANQPDEPLDDLTEQLQVLAAIREASQKFLEKAKQPLVTRKKPSSPTKPTHFSNLSFETIVAAYPKKLPDSTGVVTPFKLKRQNPIHLRAKLQTMWHNNRRLEISRLDTYCESSYETIVCFLLALEMIKDNKAIVKNNDSKVMVELI